MIQNLLNVTVNLFRRAGTVYPVQASGPLIIIQQWRSLSLIGFEAHPNFFLAVIRALDQRDFRMTIAFATAPPPVVPAQQAV